MKLVKPNSYLNPEFINENGFSLEDYNNANKNKYNDSHISLNSYTLNKGANSPGIFDDGLVF